MEVSVTSLAKTDPSCPVCGSSAYQPLAFADVFSRSHGYRLASCRGCELIRTLPVPTIEDLRALYGEGYFHGWLKDRDVVSKEVERFRRLFRLIDAELPRGKLLSVGCGLGFDLVAASEFGFDAEGLEFSDVAASQARDLLGIDVRHGTLELFTGPEGTYSVVTFWDVLEHLPHPRLALDRAKLLLAPGGVVVVRAPNVRGLFPLVSRILSPFTGEWRHPEPPSHLYEFSPSVMKKLAKSCGLEVKRILLDEWPRDKLIVGSHRPNITKALSAIVYPLSRLIEGGNSMIAVLAKPKSLAS